MSEPKIEIVGVESRSTVFWKKIVNVLNKIKLLIAIVLDLVGLAIGWLPIVNSIWTLACFFILVLILKHKKLALVSLIELPLIIPPFSIIAMFLPICTLVVLLDNQGQMYGEHSFVKVHNFKKIN
jgi:hypothetical protein